MKKLKRLLLAALAGALGSAAHASFYFTNTGDDPVDIYYWSQRSVDISTSVVTVSHEQGYEIYIEEDGAGGGATYESTWDIYEVLEEQDSYQQDAPVATLVTVDAGESENHQDEFDAPTDFVDEYLSVEVFHAEGYSAGGCWVYHEFYDSIEVWQSGTRMTTTVTAYW